MDIIASYFCKYVSEHLELDINARIYVIEGYKSICQKKKISCLK
jgi:hypothetical protein